MVLSAPPYHLLMSGNNYARTLKNDLVAYWKLDEASGSRADAVGANTLTDVNTVTGNPGPSGALPLASQFTAVNSEYLTIADNAALSMGAGVRMTVAAWTYFDSKTGPHCMVGKWQNAVSNEYALNYDSVADRFKFNVSSSGVNSTLVSADALGAPATATWYLVIGWYDGTNISIQVNNGPVTSAAFTADIFDGTAELDIGRLGSVVTQYMDGRIAGVPLWKRVLTPGERSWLYNGGAGRSWPWR